MAPVLLVPSDESIGAVAQMGERMTGSHEVRGSIPLSSTKEIKDLQPCKSFSFVPWDTCGTLFGNMPQHLSAQITSALILLQVI